MSLNEFKEEDFISKIGDQCVVCDMVIPGTWRWYKEHGNYCSHCAGLAEKVVKHYISQNEANRIIADLIKKNHETSISES